MDKTIRRNEICIIGLPGCDYAFSGTRSCFIAYGFDDSSLEMDVLKSVLKEQGIEPVEAGGALAPAQNAFCTKICSKIITSRFCVVLLNNDNRDGREVPNANVNMEYGMMLGFNKYVIPFQRSTQQLPFNAAGLDTIKYDGRDFRRLAEEAVGQAIKETQQSTSPPFSPNQVIEAFLLMKKALVTPINNEGDQSIFQLGAPLGFMLLNDFSGMDYMFFGNFTVYRPEVVAWRVKILTEILNGRRSALGSKVSAGITTEQQACLLEGLLNRLRIWVIVTSADEKASLTSALSESVYPVELFSLDDVGYDLRSLGMA